MVGFPTNLTSGGTRSPDHGPASGTEELQEGGTTLLNGVVAPCRTTATPLGLVRPGTLECSPGRSCVSDDWLERSSLRDDALRGEPPQHDQELSRERHHHDLALAPRGTTEAVAEPADNRAARLVALPDPGELHQGGPKPGIPDLPTSCSRSVLPLL